MFDGWICECPGACCSETWATPSSPVHAIPEKPKTDQPEIPWELTGQYFTVPVSPRLESLSQVGRVWWAKELQNQTAGLRPRTSCWWAVRGDAGHFTSSICVLCCKMGMTVVLASEVVIGTKWDEVFRVFSTDPRSALMWTINDDMKGTDCFGLVLFLPG